MTKVVPDDKPAFRIAPQEAWHLAFGRGSGMQGLETVKLDQDGHLVLHRMNSKSRGEIEYLYWESATFELPPDAVAKVVEAVAANGLLRLDKAYHAGVVDGTQWVLKLQQGEREKVIYFDNHFPDAIVRFATQLDQILKESSGAKLRWQTLPSARARDYEKELWNSLER